MGRQFISTLNYTVLSVHTGRRTVALTALTLLIGMSPAYATGFNGASPPTGVIHPTHNLAFSSPLHFQNGVSSLSASPTPASSNASTAGNQVVTNHGTSTGGRRHNLQNTGTISGTNHSASTVVHNAASTLSATSPTANTLPSGGYQLDLNSTVNNVVLGSTLFGNHASATINVGGTNQTFLPGQKLTAAEYVAIQQALIGSQGQTLFLNSQGAADAGKFSLNNSVNAKVTEIVVPAGVTAIDTISKTNSLTIGGDLLNYGSIYGVATGNATSGAITAADIINEKGGWISTVVPNALLSSIANANSGPTNLTLNAQSNLSNAGAITSSGALTLASVHGSIDNSSGATV